MVSMPRHGVAAVAVEAEPRSSERLSELGRIVGGQCRTSLRENEIGQQVGLVVEAEQARDVDLAVIHLPALGMPGDVARESAEQLIGPGQPTGPKINPCAAHERRSPDRWAESAEPHLVDGVEQGSLESDRHGSSVTQDSEQVSYQCRYASAEGGGQVCQVTSWAVTVAVRSCG